MAPASGGHEYRACWVRRAGMFFFFSGRAGCLRSLLISVLATGVLWLLFHR